jgi:SAM-dependent methyltransferase
MYGRFAGWFHLLTTPAEYQVEADFYSRTLLDAAQIPVTTVLELGSGGGNNASHMKARFEMTLTDLSAEMLELSQSINPGCEHVQGDMRTLRLGRNFDAVFIHDAIDYMTSEDDLRAAMTTAFEHCSQGGAVLLAPDHLRDTFVPTTDHGGNDGGDRALRYLEWTWDPDPDDDTYTADYAYVHRGGDGNVEVTHDRHICGLFSRATWIRLLEEVGFQVKVVPGVEGETAAEVFACTKPI